MLQFALALTITFVAGQFLLHGQMHQIFSYARPLRMASRILPNPPNVLGHIIHRGPLFNASTVDLIVSRIKNTKRVEQQEREERAGGAGSLFIVREFLPLVGRLVQSYSAREVVSQTLRLTEPFDLKKGPQKKKGGVGWGLRVKGEVP